eukprot:3000683-Pyramimonas_sp.AAC.1
MCLHRTWPGPCSAPPNIGVQDVLLAWPEARTCRPLDQGWPGQGRCRRKAGASRVKEDSNGE